MHSLRHEIGHLTGSVHVEKICPLKRFTHNLNGPQDLGAGHITLVQSTVGSIHTLGNGRMKIDVVIPMNL